MKYCTLFSTNCLRNLSSSVRGASVPKYSSSDCKYKDFVTTSACTCRCGNILYNPECLPCIQTATLLYVVKRSQLLSSKPCMQKVNLKGDQNYVTCACLLQVSTLAIGLVFPGSCPLALTQYATTKLIITAFCTFLLDRLQDVPTGCN